MEKNALFKKDFTEVIKNLTGIEKCLTELFSQEQLNVIAKRHGFIKRNRNLTASSFLASLVFGNESCDKSSLLGLKLDLHNNANINISREALHKKFTPEAVCFMQEVLSKILTMGISESVDTKLTEDLPFSGVFIKDSTKFTIPQCFNKDYPSYGSFGKNGALMNIQYELELLSGKSCSLELTKATRNDQQDSKETLPNIVAEGLYIRDLGYITTSYLKDFENNGAYYFNRLPKVGVYEDNEKECKAICWKKIKKHFDTCDATNLELEVYIGKKDMIKTHLIIVPVPEEVAKERIRKAKQSGKREKGYSISEEYKIKAHFNIFITNVPISVLPAEKLIATYRLRWQIELLFKAWKSHLDIHKSKPMKLERFKCQLIGNLIWMLITSNMFQIANQIIKTMNSRNACSPLKFFKFCKYLKQELRDILSIPDIFTNWYNDKFINIIDFFIIEKRLGKMTHPEIIHSVFQC